MTRKRMYKTRKERRTASNLASKLSMQRKRARDKAAGVTVSPQTPNTEQRARHNLSARKSYRKSKYGTPFTDNDFNKLKDIAKAVKAGQIPVRVGAGLVTEMTARYKTTNWRKLRGHFYGKWRVPKNWTHKAWFGSGFVSGEPQGGLKGDI